MKKLYSIIFTLLFCSSAIMAQEETTFAFMFGDEGVPNGGTVTISEFEDLMNASAAWAADVGMTEDDIASAIKTVRTRKRVVQ